jgi:AcrR family transcriptional regulator
MTDSWEQAPARGRYDRSVRGSERAVRQRERLVRAAVLVLDRYGATGVTVTRVIGRARMGRNTFYAHFDNVPDLLGEVRERGLDELLRAVEGAVENARTPIEGLRALTRAWISSVEAHPRLASAVLSHVLGADPAHLGSRATERLFDLMCELLYAAYDSGVVSRPPDEVRAWALAAGVAAVGLRRLESKDLDTEVVTEALVELIVSGFR